MARGVITASATSSFRRASPRARHTQFDWSYEVVDLGGRPTPVKVAHLRLCYSRVFLAVA